jgi:CelD/BcsL family acetyltransferase involved in cellulose biosynthesis
MNVHSPIAATVAPRTEIVRTGDRLAEIGPAWTALWEQSSGLVFQSHAWVAAWWSTLPGTDRAALRIGLVWQGERLIAVLPFAIARRRGLKILEWAAASYTDYADILRAPDCPVAALQPVWRQIGQSGGYDLALLNRLLPDAAARILATPESRPALRPNHREEISFRVGGNFTTGAAWLDSQSKKTRQNYRRGRKALEESGPVNFRLVGPEEDLGPILDRLGALKREWLEARASESELFDDKATALPALVDALHAAGILRVFVLESAGTIIAISVNFVERDTMMAFLTTYDRQVERASPGMLLMIDYVCWSIDHGLKLVDFLCGAEPFKLRFANQSVTLGTFAAARTPLGRLALLADSVRDRLRRLAEARRLRRQAGEADALEPDSDATR